MNSITSRIPAKEVSEFRYFYLKQDISQSKIAMLLFGIPIFGFIFNDYLLFGFSQMFLILTTLRALLILIITIEFITIGKVRTYLSYDRLIFSATLLLIIGGGVINATRPQNFVLHVLMTIVSIFVLYLVVPLKFRFQLFLAALMIIGETCIIVYANQAEIAALYSLLFGMFVAFILASLSSWQLHSYRYRTFKESMKRKELEESLRKNADRLAELVDVRTQELVKAQTLLVKTERLAAIGELAGMVGHDLRNPLAGIKNAAYFLRKKNSMVIDDSGHKMLTIIDKSLEHANKIVNDLLEYSREINLELEEYTPKSLIDYVLLSISIPKKIRIIDNTSGITTIMVDGDKMQRVFTNLIKNAIEAMPDGGTLQIISQQKGSNIEFTFADTGVGISDELVSKLFTPLITTKAQGMGFGLAICKRLIEAHGGEISVKSSLNKGTVFVITIPQPPKLSGVRLLPMLDSDS